MEKHSANTKRHNSKKGPNHKMAGESDDITDISEMDVMSTDDMNAGDGTGDVTAAADSMGGQKSVGTIISQSLAKESQETIDRALTEISSRFKAAKSYAVENPKEAGLIAVTAALAGWVLLGTKPGRVIFDAGAERFVPEISRWVSNNFSGNTH